eukprot:m.79769 g.79769  ORF g.79769 m.79769 type:complete len:884 (-) comp8615_c4_seq1:36-2687(-)
MMVNVDVQQHDQQQSTSSRLFLGGKGPMKSALKSTSRYEATNASDDEDEFEDYFDDDMFRDYDDEKDDFAVSNRNGRQVLRNRSNQDSDSVENRFASSLSLSLNPIHARGTDVIRRPHSARRAKDEKGQSRPRSVHFATSARTTPAYTPHSPFNETDMTMKKNNTHDGNGHNHNDIGDTKKHDSSTNPITTSTANAVSDALASSTGLYSQQAMYVVNERSHQIYNIENANMVCPSTACTTPYSLEHDDPSSDEDFLVFRHQIRTLQRRFSLNQLVFYHGWRRRARASQLLLRPGVSEGTFLLHFDTLDNQLTLFISFCTQDFGVAHVPVDFVQDRTFMIERLPFKTLKHAIAYFRRRPLRSVVGNNFLKGYLPNTTRNFDAERSGSDASSDVCENVETKGETSLTGNLNEREASINLLSTLANVEHQTVSGSNSSNSSQSSEVQLQGKHVLNHQTPVFTPSSLSPPQPRSDEEGATDTHGKRRHRANSVDVEVSHQPLKPVDSRQQRFRSSSSSSSSSVILAHLSQQQRRGKSRNRSQSYGFCRLDQQRHLSAFNLSYDQRRRLSVSFDEEGDGDLGDGCKDSNSILDRPLSASQPVRGITPVSSALRRDSYEDLFNSMLRVKRSQPTNKSHAHNSISRSSPSPSPPPSPSPSPSPSPLLSPTSSLSTQKTPTTPKAEFEDFSNELRGLQRQHQHKHQHQHQRQHQPHQASFSRRKQLEKFVEESNSTSSTSTQYDSSQPHHRSLVASSSLQHINLCSSSHTKGNSSVNHTSMVSGVAFCSDPDYLHSVDESEESSEYSQASNNYTSDVYRSNCVGSDNEEDVDSLMSSLSSLNNLNHANTSLSSLQLQQQHHPFACTRRTSSISDSNSPCPSTSSLSVSTEL